MNILISGSSGFIGSALTAGLEQAGHAVVRMVRSGPTGAPAVFWNPPAEQIDGRALGMHSLDAVVHLAGENIVGRWTPAKRAAIRESRVVGTRLLCTTVATIPRPPRVLLTASATGYYGDRGDELLTEASRPGKGFLADVCRDWEQATEPAERVGIRVVHMRLGAVLSPEGGVLARLRQVFRLGLGGRLGSGRQWVSWVALADVLGAVEHLLAHEELRGPVNVVAPQPLSNREFTQTLARVMHRPAVLPVPRWVLRLAYGQAADETLLASARVLPEALTRSGYAFQFPTLEPALAHWRQAGRL